MMKTPSSVFDQVVNVHAGARDHVARAARLLSRPTDQTKCRTRKKTLENKGGGPGKLGRASPKEARGALPLWPPQLSEEGCR